MWISRRTDYATRALVALAREDGVRPVKIQELAERTDTPVSILEQVLPQLRSAGIVRSERGPSGGYRLNHAAEDITLERVVRILQGPLAPIPCATRHEPEPCSMLAGCALNETWAEVRDATIAILERTTFADLAARSSGRWAGVDAPVAAPSRRAR
jgi:Rrf2 family transcriptional regulator, cysteine metabolism repressor